MLSYILKAGGDAQLYTEGRRRCSSTHWRPEEMLIYTLKAGGDAQLHTEGRSGCSVTHWRPEWMLIYTLKAGGDAQLHTEGQGRRRCSAITDEARFVAQDLAKSDLSPILIQAPMQSFSWMTRIQLCLLRMFHMASVSGAWEACFVAAHVCMLSFTDKGADKTCAAQAPLMLTLWNRC